jgi:hypothetical protein
MSVTTAESQPQPGSLSHGQAVVRPRPRAPRAIVTIELAPVHQDLVERELKARRRIHPGAKKNRIFLDCVTKVLGEKYPRVMKRHYAQAREI